jgi:hypothetical protein
MDSTAIVITGSGTWEFNDDQTEVITKITYVLGGTETDTFKILRLKEEELWLENNQDGDVVETHYEPK